MRKAVITLLLFLNYIQLNLAPLGAQNLDERYPGDIYPLDTASIQQPYAELFEIPGPELSAPIGLLIDAETGTILFAKNGGQSHSPASLTKIMTVYTALDIYEQMDMEMDDQAHFSSAAWWRNAPPRSSLMFIGEGHKLSLGELLTGLLVSSGNDAAMAVAETSTGSMEGFIMRMNSLASQLGLDKSHFVEPSGYDYNNVTNAEDLARLSQRYLIRWPWVIDRFHNIRSFTYPKAENVPPGADDELFAITQYNRNGLLESYPGADGLKTGYIDESGYNMVATASRDGMRLIAVVMGVMSDTSSEGSRLREADATALLDYGFDNYRHLEVELPEAEIALYSAASDVLTLGEVSVDLLVPKTGSDVSFDQRQFSSMLGPVSADDVVSRTRFIIDDVVLGSYIRTADTEIPQATGLRRLGQWFKLTFARLFSRANPGQGSVPDWD